MQYVGYLIVDEQEVKVLVRETANYRSLKKRSSGEKGAFLEDESTFLSCNKNLLYELNSDKTVNL